MARPDMNRVPEWYHRYINRVIENDLNEALRNQTPAFLRFLQDLPADKRTYRYAEGKWSIQDVLQHIIDAERVFAYRSLCFARKDPTPLASFDENEYAVQANADTRNWDDMVEEFKALRRSTEIMFKSFNEDQLDSSGIASGKSVYVLGLGFIIAGHLAHHVSVIEERYLQKNPA